MKNTNPFPINKYIGSKYFCNRIQETERIISAATNQRNIAVISEFGIGKTTLIKHIKEELKELENYSFYFVELYKTENTAQFLVALLSSVFRKGNIKSKINKYFPELDITIAGNKEEKTGKLFLTIDENNFKYFFKEFINYIETKNKKIIFALDDIQEIVKYLTQSQQKVFGNFTSASENISFIFSSDSKQALEVLLKEKTVNMEIIELQKIEKKEYAKFLKKRFTKENIKIDNIEIDYILTWSKTNTFYTSFVCNKIFNSGYKKITKKIINKTIQKILLEYSFVFADYKNILSEYQWRLLTAIAKEEDGAKITSAYFIEKYNLNAPSSVKTAIASLIQKKLIVRKNNTYFLINIFLERWICNYYKK